MGIIDRARELFGLKQPRLVELPDRVVPVVVDKLQVHTARLSPDTNEKIIIVTTSARALEELSRIDDAVQLTSPTARPVTFVPVDRRSEPVLDPKYGWIIPVTRETAAEFAGLAKGPGEHELSTLHLGLVLE